MYKRVIIVFLLHGLERILIVNIFYNLVDILSVNRPNQYLTNFSRRRKSSEVGCIKKIFECEGQNYWLTVLHFGYIYLVAERYNVCTCAWLLQNPGILFSHGRGCLERYNNNRRSCTRCVN